MADLTEAGPVGLTAPPQPPQSIMQRDFPDPPAPPPVAATPPIPAPPVQPQKFTRDIDLKDGSGVQHFEAESWEGLVDKLAQAQENATRKIRELSTKTRVEPERDIPTPKTPKALSEAELAAIREGANTDPVGTFNKLFEAHMGATPDQVRAQLNEFDSTKRRQEAETDFIRRHKDDFYNCPENAQKINAFFQKEGLQVTKKNLEFAYQELQNDFVKKEARVDAPPNLPPPPVAPGQPIVRDIPPPPVSIPANFGERPVTPQAGEVDAAEMSKIAALPPEQMKARIEQLFRAQRGSAR